MLALAVLLTAAAASTTDVEQLGADLNQCLKWVPKPNQTCWELGEQDVRAWTKTSRDASPTQLQDKLQDLYLKCTDMESTLLAAYTYTATHGWSEQEATLVASGQTPTVRRCYSLQKHRWDPPSPSAARSWAAIMSSLPTSNLSRPSQ